MEGSANNLTSLMYYIEKHLFYALERLEDVQKSKDLPVPGQVAWRPSRPLSAGHATRQVRGQRGGRKPSLSRASCAVSYEPVMPGRLKTTDDPASDRRQLGVPEVQTVTPTVKKTMSRSHLTPEVFSDVPAEEGTPTIFVSPASKELDDEDQLGSGEAGSSAQTMTVLGRQMEEAHSPLTRTEEPPSWSMIKKKSQQKVSMHGKERIMLKNYLDGRVLYDTLHQNSEDSMRCTPKVCLRSEMSEPSPVPPNQVRTLKEKLRMVTQFINEYYAAINGLGSPKYTQRLLEVHTNLEQGKDFTLTQEELRYGAKLAWRNSPRCVGRAVWLTLQIIDARHVTTSREMFEMLCVHTRHGFNNGNIRPTLTIFPARENNKPDFRIWNGNLYKYAGYRCEDGTVIGDPASIEFTEVCQRLGWRGRRGMYDVLPWILQASGGGPEVFEIPRDLVTEVEISHPKYPRLSSLGLRWLAMPAVANMMLDCAGVQFPAAPSNGWFMSSEVSCRNLGDEQRYNILPKVAEVLGLDTSSDRSMWRDMAMIELTIAVQSSFEKAGVAIQDHMTLSKAFQTFFVQEHKERGGCPADWVWIVPPISGSACPLFHQEMVTYYLRPSFLYQVDPWKTHRWEVVRSRAGPLPTLKTVAWAVRFLVRTMSSILSRRHKVSILYGTETGRSEMFAHQMEAVLKTAFDVRVMRMDDYDVCQLQHERLLLMVAATTGNGYPPANALRFSRDLYNLLRPSKRNRSSITLDMLKALDRNDLPKVKALHNVRYAVFALGSRAYPNFCAFGRFLDEAFSVLGARQMVARREADELGGQEHTFNVWARDVLKFVGEVCQLREAVKLEALSHSALEDYTWRPERFRLVPAAGPEPSLQELYTSNKEIVHHYTLLEKKCFHSTSSPKKTLFLRLGLRGGEQAVSYSPGDHLLMWAENPDSEVRRVAARLEAWCRPEEPVTVQHLTKITHALCGQYEWADRAGLPPRTSLRTALARFLDILSPPSQVLLNSLALVATDEVEASVLRNFAHDVDYYEELVERERFTFADVLDQFSSIVLTSSFLLSQLNPIKPRTYSISSSQAAHPGEVHVTAVLVQYRAARGSGKERTGFCTGYMDSLTTGDSVFISIKRNPAFHLPEDKEQSIILLGAGTGIAPFKGFWEQRAKEIEEAKKSGTELKQGGMSLYYGCRQRGADQLFAAETRAALSTGALSGLHLALSREPHMPKTYVQDVLAAQDVAAMLLRGTCHVYVCGDVRVSEGVGRTLCKLLVKAGLEPQVAANYVLKMKEFGTYHEDIFGASLDPKSLVDKKRVYEGEVSSAVEAK